MAKIPQQVTSPIAWQTPIVNPDGTMTEPFRRLMQALTGNGGNSTDIVQRLVDAELQPGTGITILPDGHLLSNPTIAADIQALLDEISSTRGSVLYRGAAAWVELTPGTANFFLQTHGAGADPTWAAQATANIQTLLDSISSTQGVVLYRDASAWVALSPGTAGDFLQTQGAGANPLWASAGGGGGGSWVTIDSWDFAIDGSITNFDVDVSGYSEVMVWGNNVTLASSGFRGFLCSVNGGSTYYNTTADYSLLGTAGGVTTTFIMGSHGTATTAARNFGGILTPNIAGAFKYQLDFTVSAARMFTASTALVDHVRVLGLATSGGASIAMNGGKVWVLGR